MGIESIFKELAQRMDDINCSMSVTHTNWQRRHIRSRSARRVSRISSIPLPWHALWQKNWSWGRTL